MTYDLIIIGSGPAGCAASIYASRYGMKSLVLGKNFGGTIGYAHRVDNYPGLLGLSGLDLMTKIEEHVKSLGGEVVYDPVDKIEKQEDHFRVFTDSEKEYKARVVIVAAGTERRKLDIPGEKELTGKGVSYCTTCDAPFFKDKTVALIGGSDAACSGAVHLSQFVKKIYLIYRKGQLRAEPFWIRQWEDLVSQGKGEAIYNTNIVKILGSREIEELRNYAAPEAAEIRKLEEEKKQYNNIAIEQLKNRQQDQVAAVELDRAYKGNSILRVDGVFIEIGGVPGADLVRSLGVELDESNYIVVSEGMETNIKGLFAAGDITTASKIMQQVITAMAQGAIAAASAYQFIKKSKAPKIVGCEKGDT